MSVQDLTLPEREALASALDPANIAAEKEAQRIADEQLAADRTAEVEDILRSVDDVVMESEKACDDLLIATAAYITARMKYRKVPEAGKAFQNRCRSAEVDVPKLTSYADRVLNDYDAKVVNRTFREVTTAIQ